jgi:hypothetical protein
LVDEPVYDALSYVWRSPENLGPVSISVDGVLMTIGANLGCALQYIIAEHPVIWIDAICINQDDNEEKSFQVPLMGRIFGLASRVIMWQGPPNGPMIDFFRQIGRYYSQTDINEKGGEGSILDFLTVAQLNAFFANPYWRRVWIIQEMVLARDGILRCGTYSLHYNQVLAACKAAFDLLGPEIHLEENWFLTTAAILMSIRGSHKQASRSLGHVLLDVHNTKRRWGSTDPRDNVYGLLGLASDTKELGIIPDYTQSVEKSYTDAARRLFKAGHVDLLYFDRLYIEEQDGTIDNIEGIKALSLPSWVPDWCISVWDLGCGDQYSASGSTTVRVRSGPPPISLSPEKEPIGIDGILVDKLTFVNHDPALSRMPWPSPSRLRARLAEIKRLCDISPLYSTAQRAQAQWRTPIMDWENVAEAPEGRRATEVSKALYEKLTAMYADEGRQGEGGGNPYGAVIKVEASASATAITPGDGSEYTYIAHRRARYTRPCLSALGYVGLAPLDAVAGDALCVFLGARMPVVVRPVGDGTFIRVGFAFVYAIMDGELLEGNHSVETIWLV